MERIQLEKGRVQGSFNDWTNGTVQAIMLTFVFFPGIFFMGTIR